MVERKMEEYRENGARPGWRYNRKLWIAVVRQAVHEPDSAAVHASVPEGCRGASGAVSAGVVDGRLPRGASGAARRGRGGPESDEHLAADGGLGAGVPGVPEPGPVGVRPTPTRMNEDGPAAAAAGHPRGLEAARGDRIEIPPGPGTRRRGRKAAQPVWPTFRPADRKINPRSRSVSAAAGDRAADPAGTGTRRDCYAGSSARARRLFACDDVRPGRSCRSACGPRRADA